MRRFQVGTFLALAVIFVGVGAAATHRHGPTLRIVVRGSGQVTCGTRCPGTHGRGDVLRLAARPAANYEFGHWSGGCIGFVPTCPIALDSDTSVRATFVGLPTEVFVAVGGPGWIASIPTGLDCGGAGYTCSLTVPFASSVTLVPTPFGNGRFAGWDGPCASAGSGACTLRIDASRTETAGAFGHSSPLPGDQPLTVSRYDDRVQVKSQPSGIDCPPTCTAPFASGTLVTLHRNIGQWQPACRGEELDRCAIVVDAPTEVGVAPPAPPPDPERPPETLIQLTVSGPGLVTSSDGRIRCGRSHRVHLQCSERVSTSGQTIVRLRRTARPGARFGQWGGACRGATLVCSLQRQPNPTLQVTALFRRPKP